MTGRINPRRRPATQADIIRAKQAARDEVIRYVSAIFLTALADKEGADAEILQRVWGEINDLSDSVAQGYVSIPDLIRTLRDEYDIQV